MEIYQNICCDLSKIISLNNPPYLRVHLIFLLACEETRLHYAGSINDSEHFDFQTRCQQLMLISPNQQ